MVQYNSVMTGIQKYAERELAPKVDGLKQFAIYMAVPLIQQQAGKLYEAYKAHPMLAGLITDNTIDLDSVYNMAKSAISKAHTIEAFGFRFGESDIDILYRCILEAENGTV